VLIHLTDLTRMPAHKVQSVCFTARDLEMIIYFHGDQRKLVFCSNYYWMGLGPLTECGCEGPGIFSSDCQEMIGWGRPVTEVLLPSGGSWREKLL
jgi:hypothetical protein